MRKLIRTAIRVLGPQMPSALAIGLAIAVCGAFADQLTYGIVAGLGICGMVLSIPAVERATSVAPVRAVGLPGYDEPRRPPVYWKVRLGVGLVTLAVLGCLLGRLGWLALVVTVLGAIAVVGVAIVSYRRMRGQADERVRIHRAVEAYQPKFAIYTGRRNDAGYQLKMWLPLLEGLGERFIVVVRHPQAVEGTKQLTTAPVICCPGGKDLDYAVVASLKAAFYVNTIALNSNFVLYRQMTHVYLGHGDSDKELSGHPAHAMFDKIFVAGPAAIERYRWSRVQIPREKFIVVGRPQLAGIEQVEAPIATIARPRVLFAPTWRGYNLNTSLSSLMVAPPLISALLERGAEVVFRPHPFSWQGRAERSAIDAVDSLLLADRGSSDRQHLLATETSTMNVMETFSHCDAMITDIGSVLVDFFATGKPYAVTLPQDVDLTDAQDRFPTTAAAYLLAYQQLELADTAVINAVLDDLLRTDPLMAERKAVAQHYLGPVPGDDRPFLDEIAKLLN